MPYSHTGCVIALTNIEYLVIGSVLFFPDSLHGSNKLIALIGAMYQAFKRQANLSFIEVQQDHPVVNRSAFITALFTFFRGAYQVGIIL